MVVVSLLRGINVGKHRRIRMDALRDLCENLGLRDVSTFIQSGNIIFRTTKADLPGLAVRLEEAILHTVGFRPDVLLRSLVEMRNVVAGNPFPVNESFDPAKLLVTFLAADPESGSLEKASSIFMDDCKIHHSGKEVYMYFANGLGNSGYSAVLFEKAIGVRGTGRNWNSVTKLLYLAEKLESGE